VLGTVLFFLGFIGWCIRWSLALAVFLLAMAGAGYYVYAFALEGNQYIRVPQLVNLPLTEAAALLAEQGLDLGRQTSIAHPSVPKFHVVSQRPEADRIVRSGRRVDVVVSMGKDYLKVPDVRGMFLDEARQIIAQSRFRVGTLARVASDAARDMILAQDPPPGETRDAQGEINLLLSAGAASATGVMPDLRGMKISDIPAVMAPYGAILVGNPVDVPGVPTDIVLDQNPIPDALIYPNQVVTYDYKPSGMTSGPSEHYETVVRHEIPVDWYDKSVRVDVIDAAGERTSVWSREPSFTDADRATYVAGTAIRIPVNYLRETTVEIYLNNTLHAAYRLKDGNPPELIAYASP